MDTFKWNFEQLCGRADGTEYTLSGLVAEKEHRIQVCKNSRDN